MAPESFWLTLDEPLDLLARASVAPWQDGQLSQTRALEKVNWQRAASKNGSAWHHDVVWCPRSGAGAIAIHRFTPREEYDIRLATQEISALADRERAAGTSDDPASNIGGFHGERDLFERPEIQQSALPALIGSAVHAAAQQEAAELGREPIPTSADEAWFNMLEEGGWNRLHTHPGTTYSGVLYVSDGGGAGSEDPLAGR
jgi:hypothetical protein